MNDNKQTNSPQHEWLHALQKKYPFSKEEKDTGRENSNQKT